MTPTSRQWVAGGIALVVLLASLAYTAWWALVARYHEHTDNAYVSGNLVQITPQTSGTVLAIQADDTDYVTAGQPLVLLDPADARVALEQAEADLAQQVRQARNLFASRAAAAAQLAVRQAASLDPGVAAAEPISKPNTESSAVNGAPSDQRTSSRKRKVTRI